MTKRKQSVHDQLERIEQFCCPVHGVPLTGAPPLAEKFSIGICPRKDCCITAIVDIIEDGKTVDFQIRHLITPEQLHRLQRMYWGMMSDFAKQTSETIAVELRKVATSPDVQLPVMIDYGVR